MKNTTHKETDLYPPIKRLLTDQGFTVRGEVKGCDIAALRDETLWVIEMKLTASLKLIFQAMARQDATDWVFVAIPRPKKANDKHFVQFKKLIKKINLGLITVALDSPAKFAEIIIFPSGNDTKKNQKTAQLKREIAGRTADTTGGTQEKVNTAYREKCIRLATLLEIHAPISAKDLNGIHGCESDTYAILKRNIYGWFETAGRGLFCLSDDGRNYLQENATQSLIIFYRMKCL